MYNINVNDICQLFGGEGYGFERLAAGNRAELV